MITVGASKAKQRFSSLLNWVAAGEGVLITKHGKAVARLIGTGGAVRADVDAAIAKLKARRTGTILGSDWKAVRDEGRR